MVKPRKADVSSRGMLGPSTFRHFLDAVPDATVNSDEAGRISYVNSHTELLLGYASAELLAQAVEFLVPASWRNGHDRHVANYLKERVSSQIGPAVELVVRH